FRLGEAEIAAALLKGAGGSATGIDAAGLREAGPIKLRAEAAQRFATPSGRLEFYSETLAKQGLPPMPDWTPDPDELAQAAKWPLRLLTAPGYFQSHTAFSGVQYLRRREGEPCAVLHPAEAAKRGLADGAAIRLHNDRGAIGLKLKVSEEVQEGVV